MTFAQLTSNRAGLPAALPTGCSGRTGTREPACRVARGPAHVSMLAIRMDASFVIYFAAALACSSARLAGRWPFATCKRARSANADVICRK